jgi:nucleoid DNA-binding protein
MITVEQLLDAVCEETTLNRDEARTAVNRIFKKAGDFIELGFSVHLGDLGYIHVTLKSDGANTPGEVTATRVTDIVPRFVFGKKTARQYQNAKVQIRKGRQCGTYHDIIPVRTRCYSGTHRIIAGLRGNSLI